MSSHVCAQAVSAERLQAVSPTSVGAERIERKPVLTTTTAFHTRNCIANVCLLSTPVCDCADQQWALRTTWRTASAAGIPFLALAMPTPRSAENGIRAIMRCGAVENPWQEVIHGDAGRARNARAGRPSPRDAVLRVYGIRASTKAGLGHPTSSIAAVDIIAILTGRHLRYDFANPTNPINAHTHLPRRNALSKLSCGPVNRSCVRSRWQLEQTTPHCAASVGNASR